MHAATIRGRLLFLSLSSRCGYYSRCGFYSNKYGSYCLIMCYNNNNYGAKGEVETLDVYILKNYLILLILLSSYLHFVGGPKKSTGGACLYVSIYTKSLFIVTLTLSCNASFPQCCFT